MAERNPLKIDDHVDLADDDPFAELTRIMGFDPRQSSKPAEVSEVKVVESTASGRVKPAPSQPAPLSAADDSADDFDIHLEK